jgi:hypothetical protein
LEVAGLAAIDAVVKAVLAQAHIVFALAQAAIPVALATDLFFIAIEADKFLSHRFPSDPRSGLAATLNRSWWI